MKRAAWFALAAGMMLVVSPAMTPARAMAADKTPLTFALRSKQLTLAIYRPSGTPKGTVIMGSGDVGWVGLSVSLAEFLSDRGYIVVGVNMRQYLSAFTEGKAHLTTDEAPSDFRELHTVLEREHLIARPTILSGVSEGAAIAVLAASHEQNKTWLDGVITMGVPATAELAWRWTDFTAWITKHDANEPSFSPIDFVSRVAPLPLVMLQSVKDEYVPEADYRRFEAAAQHPKKMVLINASNHRFTDRQPELRAEMLAALAWIDAASPAREKAAAK